MKYQDIKLENFILVIYDYAVFNGVLFKFYNCLIGLSLLFLLVLSCFKSISIRQ